MNENETSSSNPAEAPLANAPSEALPGAAALQGAAAVPSAAAVKGGESTLGLACPRCGGMVPVPEGQPLVRCPYCDLRSLVRGERGLQRYQVPLRISREQALSTLRSFLGSNRAIATDAARLSRLHESFVAFMPVWSTWARVISWVFGEKQVGSGDNRRYEPREVKDAEEMNWNAAACDVGEFGVQAVPLVGRPLEPFNPDLLHEQGMVFEPVGSEADAQAAAQADFEKRVRKAAGLDRISDVFVRMVRRYMGIVYYPIWILRYIYNGRAYQVAVDGFSGEALYGKAPGSVLYRAAVLVGGMAAGAFLSVDVSAILFYFGARSNDDSAGGILGAGLVCLIAGFALMGMAYRAFRYGEEYEFRSAKAGGAAFTFEPKQIMSQLEEASSWLNKLR